jgi:hypothetical protein
LENIPNDGRLVDAGGEDDANANANGFGNETR